MERKGRGRLSSIDLLPPEANDAIAWAQQELAKRERTQQDILFELNDRLAVAGCEPISSSAFNRYSLRRAAAVRRLSETREVAKAVAETLGPDKGDDITVMIIQMFKEAAYSLLEDGRMSAKELMELMRGLQSAMAAQKLSADQRRIAEEDLKAAMDRAAVAVADGVAAAQPGTDRAEVLRKIREEVYGIFDKAAG